MIEKPFTIHYSDRREILPLLGPTDRILNEHNSGWMIVHMPGRNWDDVRKQFEGKAIVAICEQKEYLQEVEDK